MAAAIFRGAASDAAIHLGDSPASRPMTTALFGCEHLTPIKVARTIPKKDG